MTESRASQHPREVGETLIEVIISILIMAILFVAIMSGFATNVSISAIHQRQATEQTIARDFGEYLQDPNVPYRPGTTTCPPDYSSAVIAFGNQYKLPDAAQTQPLANGDYALQIDSIKYLVYSGTGASRSVSYSTNCADEQGAQLISFTVTRPSDTSATSPKQSLQVVKQQ